MSIELEKSCNNFEINNVGAINYTESAAYKKLTYRRKKFVDFYSGNATQAAKDAGFSEKTAHSQGQRLLKIVEVQQALKEKASEEKAALIGGINERKEILTSIYRNNKAYEVQELLPGVAIGEDVEDPKKTKFVRVGVANKDIIKAIDTHNKMDGVYVGKLEVIGDHEFWLNLLKEYEDGSN